MFHIKVCGIRSVDDATAAVDVGADAIGLNFFAASKRFIRPDAARRVADAVRGRAAIVGLFVNHSADQIAETLAEVDCDWVQLHGDEPPEFVGELLTLLPSPRPVLRAIRLASGDYGRVAERIRAASLAESPPGAILLDADSRSFGGSGQQLDWSAIGRERQEISSAPLVLAGGLTPQNVAQAIQSVRPDAVDVASGVETSPGFKNRSKMQEFCRAARAAWDSLDGRRGG